MPDGSLNVELSITVDPLPVELSPQSQNILEQLARELKVNRVHLEQLTGDFVRADDVEEA